MTCTRSWGVAGVQGPEVGGGAGIGSKAMEVIIVQTIAATVPTMVKAILNSCGNRRLTGQNPTEKIDAPEISSLKSVHHRIDSESSQDGQGVTEGMDHPSEDLNNLSMNTGQMR